MPLFLLRYIYRTLDSQCGRALFSHVGKAQIWLHFSHLSKLLPRISSRYRGGNNHIVAHVPVDRCYNPLLVAQLERINYSQHFSGISPSRSRIQHGQPNLLTRVDDIHRADCERDTPLLSKLIQIILANHIIEKGDFAVRISNDGKLNVGVANLVDVTDPTIVRAKIVCTLFQRKLVANCVRQYGGGHTSPIILTPRFSNSSFSFAKAPSSVVQTGVKSAG